VTLGRRGEEIGFIAWSREDTNELKPVLNDNPSLPPSFFLSKASALACSLSAATASPATCTKHETTKYQQYAIPKDE
jgi:hypothetical protein